MRWTVLLSIILLLGLAPILRSAPEEANAPATPVIFAGDATWDFGEVAEGFVARGEIAVENRGGAPLKILNIRATCSGCSAAAATEEPIPPGGRDAVHIQFNTAGYSGRQSRILYLHCNDPKTPFIQLKVVGMVKRDPERPIVALSEDTWDAEVIAAGQAVEKSFRVRNDGKRDLEITGIYTLEPLSATCDKKKLAAGEEGEIKVRIEPKDFRGIINERVLVNTNDAVSPSKTIQVTGYATKTAPAASGDFKGAVIILPRSPVKLPGTNRVFYREYEIANGTGGAIVVRCLSSEGHTKLDAAEVTVGAGVSRVVKTVPGEKSPEEDRLQFGVQFDAYPAQSPKVEGPAAR